MNIDSIKLHLNSLKKHKVINNDEDNEEYHNNNKKNHFYETQIKKMDFFTKNEINVSKILKQVEHYYDYFHILIKHENMVINEINEKTIENTENVESKFILCYYHKYRFICSFSEFLLQSKTPHKLIHNILESYICFNKCLIQLNKMNVCFYNISLENIYIYENYKPLLGDFQKSIIIDNLSLNYLSKIMEKNDNFIYKPIETHILFYLLIKNEETITHDLSNEIINNYINNFKILKFLTLSFYDEMKKSLHLFMKKYINKSKTYIIEELVQYIETWDNYSIGFIYLYILSNIINIFELKNTFMNDFTSLVLKTIHFLPSKRENLLETTHQLLCLWNNMNSETFYFIHKIKNDKLDIFYESIYM